MEATPTLWNGRGSLVGISAFVAARVDRGGHIIVCRSRLDAGVVVAGGADDGGIELGIAAAAHGAAVDVVAAHRRRACRPSQRHGMGLTRGGGRGEVNTRLVCAAQSNALTCGRERKT